MLSLHLLELHMDPVGARRPSKTFVGFRGLLDHVALVGISYICMIVYLVTNVKTLKILYGEHLHSTLHLLYIRGTPPLMEHLNTFIYFTFVEPYLS